MLEKRDKGECPVVDLSQVTSTQSSGYKDRPAGPGRATGYIGKQHKLLKLLETSLVNVEAGVGLDPKHCFETLQCSVSCSETPTSKEWP